MDEFTNKLVNLRMPTEKDSRREWLVGVLGGSVCYGLILWLC